MKFTTLYEQAFQRVETAARELRAAELELAKLTESDAVELRALIQRDPGSQLRLVHRADE